MIMEGERRALPSSFIMKADGGMSVIRGVALRGETLAADDDGCGVGGDFNDVSIESEMGAMDDDARAIRGALGRFFVNENVGACVTDAAIGEVLAWPPIGISSIGNGDPDTTISGNPAAV
jgi:hypothetical protein